MDVNGTMCWYGVAYVEYSSVSNDQVSYRYYATLCTLIHILYVSFLVNICLTIRTCFRVVNSNYENEKKKQSLTWNTNNVKF